MNSLKLTLFTNWHLMRWVRLALGVFIGIQAIQSRDSFAGLIAGFFLFQAVFNAGCCGTSCATPTNSNSKKTTEDTTFEEIK